ncbi:MAG: lipocalin family protein, partial [Verrucomicrobiota bacterium]
GVDYPVEWKVELPSYGSLEIKAVQKNQQLQMAAMTYWEGATTIEGTFSGESVTGRGYLEMTGYDGKMTPLNQ